MEKKTELKTEYRNRLPHIAPLGAIFFVTFRMGDSLPQAFIAKLKEEMDTKIEQLKKEQKAGHKEEIKKQRKLFFKHYDYQLDILPYGQCHLRNPAVAKMVADRLHELDGDCYDLIAYCIMPNHVHILMDTSIQLVDQDGYEMEEIPENYVQLYKMMHLVKGRTSYFINKYLGRKGKFWQKDSYDHYVRDEKELWNIVHYILENPVKAGLIEKWEDYPFIYLANKFAVTI